MWRVKTFKTREQMLRWVDRNEGLCQWHEVYVNNAYAVQFRPLRQIG